MHKRGLGLSRFGPHGRRGGVLVVGDVITDVIVLAEGEMIRGSDRRAAISSRPGGSGANQAVWLGSLGVQTTLVARVAEADREGWRQYFAGHGVEAILAGDPELPTGAIVCIVDGSGERSFFTDRGANGRLSAPDIPARPLETAALFLVSGYALFAPGPRETILALLARARKLGTSFAVDPASTAFLAEVGVEPFLDWTRGAALLLANEDEAQLLTGTADPKDQLALLGLTYQTVVIKRGAKGALVGDRDGILHTLPATQVEAIDSTGAGDAFAAGFIAASLEGEALDAALARGIAMGAKAVTQVGGQPG